MIKSTAIDPSVVDADGVYRLTGPAKVFVTEPAAIAAIKAGRIAAGDVLVLICRGPMGAGMEETYQLTSALKHLPFGKHVAVLTDARFSGVSTGACIGHVSPEALAGGPIGKLRDGDLIEIVIDRDKLEGTVNFVGEGGVDVGAEAGAQILAARPAAAGSGARSLACRTTRGSGRRCRTPAAAPGAAASSGGAGPPVVVGGRGALGSWRRHRPPRRRCRSMRDNATLVGRAWLPDANGPSPVVVAATAGLRPVAGRADRERTAEPRRSGRRDPRGRPLPRIGRSTTCWRTPRRHAATSARRGCSRPATSRPSRRAA